MSVPPAKTRHFVLGWHCVAYLDVLGQRERFPQMTLDKDPEKLTGLMDVLRDTAGFILDLRDYFDQSFERFEKGILQERYTGDSRFQPKVFSFSDSFVASVPMRNNTQQVTTSATICSILSAACNVMPFCFARKHAMRGGIELGEATELSEKEIYGSALVTAYRLENEYAKYPRVIVGPKLWEYLRIMHNEHSRFDTPEGRFVSTVFRQAMDLITVDGDEEKILDYLGPGIQKVAAPDHAKVFVHPSYEFVLEQQQRWISMDNKKLSERYALLRKYFESRLHLWGLKPSSS